jgi:hypothetical protein
MNITPHPLAAAAPTPFPRSTRPENGKTVEIFDRRHRFLVATPSRGHVTETYLYSLRVCEQQPLVRYREPDGSVKLDSVLCGRIGAQGDSHVDRARNVTANRFMLDHSHIDWLLWIDDDIEFHPQHIARLFQHAMNGYKFVCGAYAMKCLEPRFIVNVRAGVTPDPQTGLIEVADAGTGFMLLHRDVFTALQSHPMVVPYACAPNTPWPGQKNYPYFQSGTYGPTDANTGLQNWLSEDWMICRLWQELGGKVFVDTEIKLRHRGEITYPPTVDELADPIVMLLQGKHKALARHIPRLEEALAAYKTANRPLAA